MSYVYMIVADMSSIPMIDPPRGNYCLFKVGMSGAPWSRCANLQTSCPMNLSIERIWKFENREIARAIEKKFHENNDSSAVRGEWFCDDMFAALDLISTTIVVYAFEDLGLYGNSLEDFLVKTGMGNEYARDVILANLGEVILQ